MPVSLDEEGEMSVGTQAPIGYEPIPWLQGWVDRLHPGESVGQEGRDHPL
jgi:hypothetical protein